MEIIREIVIPALWLFVFIIYEFVNRKRYRFLAEDIRNIVSIYSDLERRILNAENKIRKNEEEKIGKSIYLDNVFNFPCYPNLGDVYTHKNNAENKIYKYEFTGDGWTEI